MQEYFIKISYVNYISMTCITEKDSDFILHFIFTHNARCLPSFPVLPSPIGF